MWCSYKYHMDSNIFLSKIIFVKAVCVFMQLVIINVLYFRKKCLKFMY